MNKFFLLALKVENTELYGYLIPSLTSKVERTKEASHIWPCCQQGFADVAFTLTISVIVRGKATKW